MNIFITILIIIGFLALVCTIIPALLIFIGYMEELDLFNRLFDYGVKLARRRKKNGV